MTTDIFIMEAKAHLDSGTALKILEAASKPRIMFESKAQADEKVVVPSIRIVCEHFKEVCNAAVGH